MTWTNDPALPSLLSDVLALRLRVERLRVMAEVHNATTHLKAMGVPADVIAKAFTPAPTAPVTYELPPIRHLDVHTTGDF